MPNLKQVPPMHSIFRNPAESTMSINYFIANWFLKLVQQSVQGHRVFLPSLNWNVHVGADKLFQSQHISFKILGKGSFLLSTFPEQRVRFQLSKKILHFITSSNKCIGKEKELYGHVLHEFVIILEVRFETAVTLRS